MALTIKKCVSENDRHLKDVATLLFHEGKLFSGGEDGIVKVWDPNLRLLAEFQAHEVNVYHLAAIGNTLYTCSNDGTIQAWLIDRNFAHKKTLLKYDDEVYRLYPDDGKLYCGDNKGMIGVFENDECLLIYNFIEEVSDMIVKGSLIYTVRDRDLVITELTGKNGRYSTRQTLEGSNPMCLVGSKLCFAARSGRDILVHDNSKDSAFKELARLEKSHDMIINALCAGSDGHSLYSGSWDKLQLLLNFANVRFTETSKQVVDGTFNKIKKRVQSPLETTKVLQITSKLLHPAHTKVIKYSFVMEAS